MYIKLNVLQNGTCAQIIASTEPHEAPYQSATMFTRRVKIWHNGRTESLNANWNSTNYDNDDYVTFKSTVPFATFCEQFSESEYNKPIRYDMMRHNCAHAAHYALGLANINLPLRLLYLVPLSVNSWAKIPLPILSPLNIFYMARDHKDQQINHAPRPLSRVNFQVELAATTLGFWSRSNSTDPKSGAARTIAKEIKIASKIRPHHNEQYLETVYQTLDMLLHGSEIPKGEAYGFYNLFRKREMSKAVKVMDRYMNASSVVMGLSVSFSILNYNFNWLPTTYSITDRVASSLVSSLIVLAFIYHNRSILEQDENHKAPVIDTPLSQALEQVKIASNEQQSMQFAL